MTQEQPPYHLAARYPNKTPVGKAYNPIQTIIFEEDCDLSEYRFFEQKDETLAALMDRRAQQTQIGSWVERHYHIDQE